MEYMKSHIQHTWRKIYAHNKEQSLAYPSKWKRKVVSGSQRHGSNRGWVRKLKITNYSKQPTCRAITTSNLIESSLVKKKKQRGENALFCRCILKVGHSQSVLDSSQFQQQECRRWTWAFQSWRTICAALYQVTLLRDQKPVKMSHSSYQNMIIKCWDGWRECTVSASRLL
jgi:hypothetical protein